MVSINTGSAHNSRSPAMNHHSHQNARLKKKYVLGFVLQALIFMGVGCVISDVLKRQEGSLFQYEASNTNTGRRAAKEKDEDTGILQLQGSGMVQRRQDNHLMDNQMGQVLMEQVQLQQVEQQLQQLQQSTTSDNGDGIPIPVPVPPKKLGAIPSTKFTKKKHTISLVTSFFAVNGKTHAHLEEIRLAILTNLHNKYFQQIVVILDGADEDADNCQTFSRDIEELQQAYTAWGLQHDYWQPGSTPPSYKPDKLKCVDRFKGQPSYHEMFQYATDPTIVTSEVVVMANADQAFDDTIKWARQLKETSLLTLSTWGYNQTLAPLHVQQHFGYKDIVLTGLKEGQTEPWIRPRCHSNVPSWDGYVFHVKRFQGRLDPHHFARKLVPHALESHGHQIINGPKLRYSSGATNPVPPKMALINMNENGAEYAALWALLQSAPEAYDANGCSFIQMWHFHVQPKMHGIRSLDSPTFWDWSLDPIKQKHYEFVPPPYHFPRYQYQKAFWSGNVEDEEDHIDEEYTKRNNCLHTTYYSIREFATASKYCQSQHSRHWHEDHYNLNAEENKKVKQRESTAQTKHYIADDTTEDADADADTDTDTDTAKAEDTETTPDEVDRTKATRTKVIRRRKREEPAEGEPEEEAVAEQEQ